MSARRNARPFAWFAALVYALGCSAADTTSTSTSSASGAGGANACVPGFSIDCQCAGNLGGRQVCLPDGSGFGVCACEQPLSTSASSTSATTGGGTTTSGGGEVTCPNKVCDEDENCHTCEVDCGLCKPCDLAPKCKNAAIPKADLAYMPELDVQLEEMPKDALVQRLKTALEAGTPEVRLLAAALDPVPLVDEHPGIAMLRKAFATQPDVTAKLRQVLARVGMPSPAAYRAKFPVVKGPHLPPAKLGDADPIGGTVECGQPLLSLAMTKMAVNNRYSFWSKDTIFCVMQAEAESASEIHVTPASLPMDSGDSTVMSLASGQFWGSSMGPIAPKGSILVTYDCLLQQNADNYAKFVQSVSDAALAIGALPLGTASYVLIGIGAVGTVVSAALGLVDDVRLVNRQQTIPLEKELELTNGRKWYLKAGKPAAGLFDDGWEWQFTIQAWGCAEYGSL